ncbi:uncharacterized protein LOC131936759 [Physella acuta]|uniref:uncharacterized protein LOC131936759 n=1 Tax=Physella acuta TaxID=109671 RepID=UPI0027DBD4F6|nr:uncharacterized protein LOC131936759 [Physella acuta]
MRERTKSQKDLMNEDKVLDIHTAVYDGVESYFNDESNLCNSNVNAQTTKGWTPLMVACSITDRTSIAETLLKAGADVNLINNEGWTARELAQFFKLDEIENLFKRTGGCFNGEPVTLHPSLITETIRPDWCKCGSCLPQDCKEKEVCCHQIRDKIKKKKMRRFVEKKCITTSGSFKDTSLNKTYLDTNWSKFKFGSKPCTTPEYIELACKVFKINVTGQCIEEMVVPACVLQETELKFSSEKCTHETTG